MNPTDFLINVTAHPELTGIGGQNADPFDRPSPDDMVFVRHEPTDHTFGLTIAEIKEHAWLDIEAVLTRKRPAKVMVHMARIVGYYSRVTNWNRGKLAELRDRHLGNYALPEGQYKWKPA